MKKLFDFYLFFFFLICVWISILDSIHTSSQAQDQTEDCGSQGEGLLGGERQRVLDEKKNLQRKLFFSQVKDWHATKEIRPSPHHQLSGLENSI